MPIDVLQKKESKLECRCLCEFSVYDKKKSKRNNLWKTG